MKSTIRFGIAAAAALALAPSGRATDEQASEVKDDVARAEASSPATAHEARAALPGHRSDGKAEAAAKPAEDLGSGSGEPARATEAELKQAEELQRIWTSP